MYQEQRFAKLGKAAAAIAGACPILRLLLDKKQQQTNL